MTTFDPAAALARHFAKACFNRFCACHGHTCNPPTLAAGETWTCDQPKCRMIWTGEPIDVQPEWARRFLRDVSVINRGRRAHSTPCTSSPSASTNIT